MKRFSKTLVVVLTLALVISTLSITVSAKKPGQSPITEISLDGEKNVEGDTAPKEVGWAGAAIKVGEKDIVVTGVGRMFFKGANISHAFLITDSTGALMLSGVAVQGYDDSVDGTFEYCYLDKSEYITLLAGETYYLCSDFYGSTDKFYNASKVKTDGSIEFIGSVDLVLADGSWAYTENPGIDNIPLDILYMYAEEETTEAPTEEKTTEAPTEEKTEAPTEEKTTEAPTEAPTEEKTEAKTEAPTEKKTEAPTEKKTEAPTEKKNEEQSTEKTFPVVPVVIAATVVVAVIIILVLLKKKKKAK